jgi:hypothetical protein
MSDYWPNDDGRTWTYDQHYQEFTDTPADVVHQAQLYFDGATVAPMGIAAQVLRSEGIPAQPPPALASRWAPAEVSDPFLRTLWRARPDLHGAIAHAVETASACPQDAPTDWYGVLLGGNLAYVKTADDVAAWRCNRDDTKSWIWLVSNLTIGNSVTLQLVPDLADDVFLHVTVAALEDVTVHAGVYPACLRVEYLVEYGSPLECIDYHGNSGHLRFETTGYIDFAAGVGPVRSLEEFANVAVDGLCASGLQARTTNELRSDPVPVRATTWGALKAIYR